MPLLRRHRYALIALALYWPGIFLATHIPTVPGWVCEAGISDKTIHFLAYLVLVFLAWLAISPYEKVSWRRPKVWVALAIIIWYGAFDEWLQGCIGRSADVRDFYANLAGTLAGLGILSVLSFWPGALAISAVYIFTITNLSVIGEIYSQTSINISFHFLAYAGFTLIWIQYIDRYLPLRKPCAKWFLTALALPGSLLVGTKLCSVAMGKNPELISWLTAGTAIVTTVFASVLTGLTTRLRGSC